MIKYTMQNLKQSNLQKSAEERLGYLIKCKTMLDSILSASPAGKIHMAKNGKRIQFYLRDCSTKKEKYISKEKSKVISTYLQKAYNEKAVRLVEKEICVLEKFIFGYGDKLNDIRKLYSDLPEEIKPFIIPLDISEEDFVKTWQEMPYKPKEFWEGETIYITDRGEHVRSKSELLIANSLNKSNIPYKYECPLILRSGFIIYPDFTVLNPKTRREYYWEHRGMMDDREYTKHSVARMKDYGKSGIVLGQKLIITEETSASPLGSDEITRIIHGFLETDS